MSNYLSIAVVTETLRQMLESALTSDFGDLDPPIEYSPTATSVLPSRDNGVPDLGVNIFLYQVSLNSSFRNADLPTRRTEGSKIQRPRSAWDLHYLFTFYGNEKKQEPQRVLGSVIRALHSKPLITREMIEGTKLSASYLGKSDLDDEVERVKFTPNPMSLEDLSKIWSVFFKENYSLSTAYQASVVFIEGSETPQPALPVRERKVHVRPISPPVIDEVNPQFVKTGENLTITGQNLKGDIVKVVVKDFTIVPDHDKVEQDNIQISVLPDIRAGIKTLQVIHELDFGTPNEPHKGFSSNTGVFILRPTITVDTVNAGVVATVDGVDIKDGTIKIDFTPKVGKSQRVVLLFNQFNPPAGKPARSYSFQAPPDNGITVQGIEETDSITFDFAGVVEDSYLIRVQVDGAENELEVDGQGKFINPQKDI